MTWARILTPLAGEPGDSARLEAAEVIAGLFNAEVAAVYLPLEAGAMTPWISDGVGVDAGVEIAALSAIRQANDEGRVRAQAVASGRAHRQFIDLSADDAPSLVLEARLSDVVVFDAHTACGKGRLADPFRNLLMSEQRPVIVARPRFSSVRNVTVAWDGGKEATRAVRTALPLLAKAGKVTVLCVPDASSREFSPQRLIEFLESHRVIAHLHTAAGSDAAAAITSAARELQTDLLVAGAYGHTRWREVIFGGVTKTLIGDKEGPSLFLSH